MKDAPVVAGPDDSRVCPHDRARGSVLEVDPSVGMGDSSGSGIDGQLADQFSTYSASLAVVGNREADLCRRGALVVARRVSDSDGLAACVGDERVPASSVDPGQPREVSRGERRLDAAKAQAARAFAQAFSGQVLNRTTA